MSFKSRFVLHKQQRNGIFILSVLILLGLGLFYLVELPVEEINDPEIAIFQARIDSLKLEQNQDTVPKIYPFNPNFISDYKGYVLGMSTGEIDRLHRFREKDQWINSVADFKQVTGVSDSLLSQIAPHFKFPDWVIAQQQNKTPKPKFTKNVERLGINEATIDQLIETEGLNKEYAIKIINYRRRLGGFLEIDQLFDVYGLKAKTVYKLKDRFEVKTQPEINKIAVNDASASDLSTIPYISFELAREIINYRSLHEGITKLDELLKIDGVNDYKLERIKLYLYSDQ